MAAIALAAGSSLAIGAADFLAGVKARELGVLTVLVVSQPAGFIVLSLAIGVDGLSDVSWTLASYAALSALAQLCGVVAFWRALTIGAMGVVAPVTATGALIPVTVGFTRGESPSDIATVGIALAVVGVMLASYGGSARRNGCIADGVGVALVAAVALGLFYVGIDAASEHGSALSAGFLTRLWCMAFVVVPAIVLRSRISVRRSDLPAVAAVGILEVVGIFCFSAASTSGLLPLVTAVAALYPLPTALLAWLVVRERLRIYQRAGSGLAVMGLAVMAAGAVSR